MKSRLYLAVAAAAVLQAGCAHAQQATPGPGATAGQTVRRPPPPFYTGISWRGSPTVQADGTMRSAEPPVITAVAPGSPAERAGLQVGDHILLVNGKDAREPGLLRPRAAGLTFVFRVRRGDALHEITVVSAPNPAAAQR